MNQHEAERIAAAMHELRPDWPAASVLTLIRKNLMTKPRRDVTVALAWVACESASHTPARVLETGPWWKASAAETGGATRPHAGSPPWCKNCACGKDAPIHSNGDCEFTIWPVEAMREQRRLERLAELRGEVAAAKPKYQLYAVPAPEGERCTVKPCIRAAEHTGPHLGPADASAPQPEPPEPTAESEEVS